MRIRALAFAAAVVLPVTTANAQVVSASYTLTGSPGDWFLNFVLTNGFTALVDQNFYFFGTNLPNVGVVGSPAGFSQWNGGGSWDNVAFGGSATVYNNNWINGSLVGVTPGTSVGGFVAHVTTVAAPGAVEFFAYSYGRTPYNGPEGFNHGINPGFEGIANAPVTATPEPASLALLATGLVGLGGYSFKRRKRQLTV